jgi:hypothetical protein
MKTYVDIAHGDVSASLIYTSITGVPELLYESHNGSSFRCFITFKTFLRSTNFSRPRSFIDYIILCLFYHRPLPLAYRTFSFAISPHCFLPYVLHFFPFLSYRNSTFTEFRIYFCYRHLLALSVQPMLSTVLRQNNTKHVRNTEGYPSSVCDSNYNLAVEAEDEVIRS